MNLGDVPRTDGYYNWPYCYIQYFKREPGGISCQCRDQATHFYLGVRGKASRAWTFENTTQGHNDAEAMKQLLQEAYDVGQQDYKQKVRRVLGL